MSEAITFDRGLYRGTAGDYDRFRVAYPHSLIGDLIERVQPSGHGRLLDLACGTGQITFAAAGKFGEIWAVDQEPDMTVLIQAGLQRVGSYRFPTDHDWTADELIGYVYSTSVLPRGVLADHANEFERELGRELGSHATGGKLRQTTDFAYELASRPK